MSEQPRFLPASSFTLDAFAEIFTRSFEAYFYESIATAATLAARVRVENIDLSRSLVMLVGDEPAGQALLALRGARAWCGGFGVLAAFRGRGLAHPLAAALVDQARQAGARSFGLEVLTLKGFHLTNGVLPNALYPFMEACQVVATRHILGDCNAARSTENGTGAFTENEPISCINPPASRCLHDTL